MERSGKDIYMTWQIVVGIFTMLSAFISVVTVAIRVNRAIVLLEAAVKQLDNHVNYQEKLNRSIEKRLYAIERRVFILEKTKKGELIDGSEIEADFA